MMTRREWIRAAAQAAIAAAAADGANAAAAVQPSVSSSAPGRPTFIFFSKPLPELAWGDLGRAVREAGYEGVDLTVRAKGHVLPERATEDLPRAIDALKLHGLTVPMITTELTSASDPTAKPVLQTAARHGVRYFKTGYWRFSSSSDVRAQVAAAGQALAGLTALARDSGIQLGFHNHAAYVGAALWDIAPAIDRLDPQWAGYYFDPRHAVAEGGGGAWKAATHLVLPRLKMVALKDCLWEKTEKGWRIENCPLGEGMVDWAWIGSALRGARFSGPVSLHLEYEIAGATPEERTRRTIDAARRDLAVATKYLT
jgi:sugar phosphate isomerase/epimerase